MTTIPRDKPSFNQKWFESGVQEKCFIGPGADEMVDTNHSPTLVGPKFPIQVEMKIERAKQLNGKYSETNGRPSSYSTIFISTGGSPNVVRFEGENHGNEVA